MLHNRARFESYSSAIGKFRCSKKAQFSGILSLAEAIPKYITLPTEYMVYLMLTLVLLRRVPDADYVKLRLEKEFFLTPET